MIAAVGIHQYLLIVAHVKNLLACPTSPAHYQEISSKRKFGINLQLVFDNQS